jgi:hypothetical protein
MCCDSGHPELASNKTGQLGLLERDLRWPLHVFTREISCAFEIPHAKKPLFLYALPCSIVVVILSRTRRGSVSGSSDSVEGVAIMITIFLDVSILYHHLAISHVNRNIF